MSGSLPRVVWSDRLEFLAEALFAEWESISCGDPFFRICVAVEDMSARDWLKDWFLLHRGPGRRSILANIDFKPLPELVNDWLAAVCGTGGASRRSPSEHPYAKGVLAWRIDRILAAADPVKNPADAVFAPLAAYIGRTSRPRRRFELSLRLARMYDDYLNCRHSMLARWEGPGGGAAGDEEPWQAELYRRLADENPFTYVKDYNIALGRRIDPEDAFRGGFPRYRAIHVFDAAFAPCPYFRFVSRMALSVPVTIWNFNPCRGFWMDAPDQPLLGVFAKGARGAFLSGVDVSDGDCIWIGGDGRTGPADETEGEEPFSSLHALESVEVHSCHSPRRELEAVRNGISLWFSEHPGSHPRNVRVLCADWEKYAPVAEAVFRDEPDPACRIPLALDGSAYRQSTLACAFSGLLAFRDNRFEADAVFSLLDTPAVRLKAGISAYGTAVLKELARTANIRWGYDDPDVAESTGVKPASGEGFLPYTWRRGLDRLALDALTGPRDSGIPMDAGELGTILPCGDVDGDRAKLVSRLDAFVRRLHAFRNEIRIPRTAAGWNDLLQRAIDVFFLASGGDAKECGEMKKTVASAARDARLAWIAAGGRGAGPQIEPEVFVSAVLSGIRGADAARHSHGDAVVFAPLKYGSAAPADMVWICGLNDGAFPRSASQPSFDQIWKHPTAYDASPRDRDTLAFLKAALCARRKLVFSHVGKDIRTNAKIAPAVPLSDMTDWFETVAQRKIVRYSHPLQSYSTRYFLDVDGDPLPPNFSSADRDAAGILAGAKRQSPAGTPFKAFDFSGEGETHASIEDLGAFISRPRTFLRRKLEAARIDSPPAEVESEETAVAKLGSAETADIKLHGALANVRPDVLVEQGKAGNAVSAENAISAVLESQDRDRMQRRTMHLKQEPPDYASAGTSAVELLGRAETAQPSEVSVNLEVCGRPVGVRGEIRLAEDKGMMHQMAYSEYHGEFGPVEGGILVKHLAGHASGRRFVSTILYGDGKLESLLPLPQEEAKSKLAKIVQAAFAPIEAEKIDFSVPWKEDSIPEESFSMSRDGVEFVQSARLGKK